MKTYETEISDFYKRYPSLVPEADNAKKSKKEKQPRPPKKLFNKVVKVNPEDTPYSDKYKYYYVLTYLPDLQWCHICPMKVRGKFCDTGRDKYVLVNEDEESEIDLSAVLCKIVKARAKRRTQDADKEEWDIIDEENS